MADILDDLIDLYKQATTERRHYYVAKTSERAVSEIKRLRAALKILEDLGLHGTSFPNYTEWLTFHDKVAEIAGRALQPE